MNNPDIQYTDVSVIRNKLYISYYDKKTKEKKISRIERFKGLSLYQRTTKNEHDAKSYIGDHPLKKINFPNIKEYNEFLFNNKDIEGYEIYGDFNIENKYIANKFKEDIVPDFSLINIGFFDIETTVSEKKRSIKEAVAKSSDRITSIVLYASKSKKYYVLTDKKISDKYFLDDETYLDDSIEFEMFSFTPDFVGEYKLIGKFLEIVNEIEQLDVLTAYFGDLFDVPYIYNRIAVLNETKELYEELDDITIYPEYLSPLDSAYYSRNGNLYIKGIQIIDYFDLYRKFTYGSLESWKLDFVAKTELGVGKVSYDGDLMQFYNENYDKYVYYNFVDVKLLVMLEEKLKFIDLSMYISYLAKQNLKDVLSPVRTWESIIYNELLKRNKEFNPYEEKFKVKYIGGYTHKPKVKFYNYVLSFDLNSLYPHLIMMFFISPETFLPLSETNKIFGKNESYLKILELRRELEAISSEIPYDKKKVSEAYDTVADKILNEEIDLSFLEGTDITITPALEFFRKDENAVVPKFMYEFYNIRKKIKQKKLKLEALLQQYKDTNKNSHYKKLQDFLSDVVDLNEKISLIDASLTYIRRWGLTEKALKILLNSVYGAFGNIYFRFFSLSLAKSITTSGRIAIRSLIKSIEDSLRKRYYDIFNEELDDDHDFFIYSDTDSIYITIEKLIPEIIMKYKKIINYALMNNHSEMYNEVMESGFFDNIPEHFKNKSNIVNTLFNPSDMMTNGLVQKCVKVEIDENDLKEFKKYYIEKGYKSIYKRYGLNDTIHIFFIDDDVDKYKKEFSDSKIDIKSIVLTYPLDDYANTIIQKIIDENYKKLSKLTNSKNKMVMKRETICINGFWIGKKNYALNVIDSENVFYEHPKIKITGINKKNNIKEVRDNVTEFVRLLLSQKDLTSKESRKILNDYVIKSVDDFKKRNYIDYGQITQVNYIDKYIGENGKTLKGAQAHIKASINFNKYIIENKLNYDLIQEGDKIRYVYLKHNKYGFDVIGFKEQGLPEEFVKYIDVDEMIKVSLYSMYNIILKASDIELDYKRKNKNILDFL